MAKLKTNSRFLRYLLMFCLSSIHLQPLDGSLCNSNNQQTHSLITKESIESAPEISTLNDLIRCKFKNFQQDLNEETTVNVSIQFIQWLLDVLINNSSLTTDLSLSCFGYQEKEQLSILSGIDELQINNLINLLAQLDSLASMTFNCANYKMLNRIQSVKQKTTG